MMNPSQENAYSGNGEPPADLSLSKSLKENIEKIEERFKGDEALLAHRMQIHFSQAIDCCLFYVDVLAKRELVSEFVIQPIISFRDQEELGERKLMDLLLTRVITNSSIHLSSDPNKIMLSLLSGETILLAEGEDQALIIGTTGLRTRSITEPESEKLVRGPREGFTESMSTNLSLVRKRIKQDKLKFHYMVIGRRTQTRICVSYLEDIASDQILQELLKRLGEIDMDGILDSGYIQELIKDSPYSPFDTVGYSERPDVIAGKLLEGRIAVFVDGSPTVLTVPFLLVEYFQVPADYYNNYMLTSFNRILRQLGAFLSISIPAIYLAIVTFNQEMIPTPLLLSISSSRIGIPFPTIMEALMMIVIFEILREAGTRIPAPVGQAVSIVGALVLGQAAVDARIVSAPMVIVVGLTGITALLTIRLQGATVVIRFLFLFLAAFLGLYGYLFGLLGLLIHLMGMRSFGVPYMQPFNEINPQAIKDTLIRAPWWDMKMRPARIAVKNRVRQSRGQGGNKH